MALVVQKYGGSSVGDADSLHRVARRIVQTREAGHDVAVVVSAMGDTTDDLLDLTRQITREPTARELDMLLTAGERISMALLAMAIHELDHPAVSFTGAQAGLRTTDDFGAARILEVTPDRITETLRSGAVAIVAGFQGWSDDDVTTLGRGGSDTTAVALAAALDADVCEIYTDVDGLYSADPRVVSHAQQLPVLTSEEALELSAHGAKILHLRSVELARRHGVPLHVRSSFGTGAGTWVTDDPTVVPPDHPTVPGSNREESVEEPVISGVAHSHDQSKVTVVGVPDVPGTAAAIFAVMTGAVSTVDMVGQTHTAADTGLIDFSFALPVEDGRRAMDALRAAQERLGFADITYTDAVGKVSVVGVGMRSTPEVPAQLFEALAQAGITVHLIATSEIRLSAVVDEDQLEEATRVLHEAFGLGAEDEAVVHAGSGR
ncbi:aspartate kinase [Barrientosiimonas humi]|uniref:Aspartokinase n=2 Tax=Barrientosiimonas TaxID=1535207 RepID=A0A542XGJ8_9MICO|nr:MULTISPECIES: aspartate kinase [Barrientosiimonas]TQL34953.1 aspartate kinase [Barrientosiimonas humi]BDZ60113.1 aspartokinase [Barrientosiimonas endolithica]CAG7571138.1 Aspartokinase [Barrientosiimonas humi]